LELAAATEKGGELIGDAAMVAARARLADPGVHQPTQRREDINRRGDPTPVELA
jgi:hypothetical protein